MSQVLDIGAVRREKPQDFTDNVKNRRFRPARRPRTSGLVGPEPDWEVIYSSIPFKVLKQYFDVCEFSHMEGLFPRNGVYTSPKGMIHTSGMTSAHVLAWTEFAHRNGVQFNGKKDYRFPQDVEKFVHVNKHRVRHHRNKKGINPFKPPVVEGKLSSKELRRRWWRNTNKMKFKDFKATEGGPRAFLSNRKVFRNPLPDLVLKALVRIYSAPPRVSKTLLIPEFRKTTPKERSAAKQQKRQQYDDAIRAKEKARDDLMRSLADVKIRTSEWRIQMDAISSNAVAAAVLNKLRPYYRPFEAEYCQTLATLVAQVHEYKSAIKRHIMFLYRDPEGHNNLLSPQALRDRVQANLHLISERFPGRTVCVEPDTHYVSIDGYRLGSTDPEPKWFKEAYVPPHFEAIRMARTN